MTTEKKKPTKKIVDVSHPDKTPAQATSKPVIVKNRSLAVDPMMVTDTNGGLAVDDSAEKARDTVTRKGLTIQPLHTDNTEDKTDSSQEGDSLIVPVLPIEKFDSEKPKKVEISEESPEDQPSEELTTVPGSEEALPEEQPTPAPVPAEEELPEAEVTPKIAKPASPAPQSASDEKKPEPSIAPDVSTPPSTSVGMASHATDTEDDLVIVDEPNVAEVKAARAAAERELALQKLIDDGTYYLPLDTVKKRRTKQVLLVLILVLVLALAGTYLASQAGLVKIPGLSQ